MLIVTLLALVMAELSAQIRPPQDWAAADASTVRLEPSAFTDLPAPVRRYLERRGCTVPQSFASRTPHNVIRGRFSTSQQTDLAVLCSRSHVSTVLVFRGGDTGNVAELAETPDRNYLQGVGGQAIAFSRKIDAVSPTTIRRLSAVYNAPKPPPLEHDGISDSFLEKASVVRYWYRDRWLQLQGVD
jgi:hypothetical protein